MRGSGGAANGVRPPPTGLSRRACSSAPPSSSRAPPSALPG